MSTENPFAGQGSVLLDIGGDVGALVVEMPAPMEGAEVEIRLQETAVDGHAQHVAVVCRPVSGARIPSLVFPALVAGEYWLREKHEDRAHGPTGDGGRMTAAVVGGRVTYARWPG
jgi:hypothetical protein